MSASSHTFKITNVMFCLLGYLTSYLEKQKQCIKKETLHRLFQLDPYSTCSDLWVWHTFHYFAFTACQINEIKTYEMGFLLNVQWAKLAQTSEKVFQRKQLYPGAAQFISIVTLLFFFLPYIYFISSNLAQCISPFYHHCTLLIIMNKHCLRPNECTHFIAGNKIIKHCTQNPSLVPGTDGREWLDQRGARTMTH